jgi:hypothetical protein
LGGGNKAQAWIIRRRTVRYPAVSRRICPDPILNPGWARGGTASDIFSAGDTAEQAFDNVREAIEAHSVERFFGPAEKINITVPGRLLKQIDEHARAHGETRSGFLTKAALEAMRRA